MRKLIVVCAVVSLAAACQKKTDATAEGGATTATSGTTASSAGGGGGVVAKGLSFLTGGPMQGEMDFNVKSEKSAGTMKIFAKGTKQRVEMNMTDKPLTGAIIMDDVKKEMIMLDDAKKTAMVMHLDADGKPQTPGGPVGGPGATKEAPECKPTGKSDTVAGYDCNICVSDATDSKSEACVANGLSLLGGGGGMLGSLVGKVAGFPLRVIKTAKSDGHEMERFEVTKIERKALGDDMFSIPAGYKTMDMAEMFKNLGAPRR